MAVTEEEKEVIQRDNYTEAQILGTGTPVVLVGETFVASDTKRTWYRRANTGDVDTDFFSVLSDLEKYPLNVISASGSNPPSEKINLVDASAGEVNTELPAVLAGDNREYVFVLKANGNHHNLTVAGGGKMSGVSALSQSTVNSTVRLRADGVSTYTLIEDTRVYYRYIKVTGDLDLTSGFESGGLYDCVVPDSTSITITIDNFDPIHTSDRAKFLKRSGVNSTVTVVSQDGTFNEVLTEDNTSFTIAALDDAYGIVQDSRTKEPVQRINFYPTGDPSVLDPTYFLLLNENFSPEVVVTSIAIPSSDSLNPTVLGEWLNDDKALAGTPQTSPITALGTLALTSSFNRFIRLRFKYYQYDIDTGLKGPLLSTTEYSRTIATTTPEQVFVQGTLPSQEWFSDTSNKTLVIVLEAYKTASGGDNPTIDITTGGDNASKTFVDLPATAINHDSLSGKQIAGVGVPFGHVSSTVPLVPANLTTAERDAYATPVAGMIIQNTTTGQLEQYQGVTWVPVDLGGASPYNYGAVGDGVSDDAVTLQACLDDNAGGVVNISGGTWATSAKLTVAGGTKIINTGNSGVFTRLGQTVILEMTDALGLEGVTVSGNSGVVSDAENLYPLVVIKSSSRDIGKVASIEKCNFRDSNSTAVMLDNVQYDIDGDLLDDYQIKDNAFYNIEASAIFAYRTTYVGIGDNSFRDCFSGIVFQESANFNIGENIATKVGRTVGTNWAPLGDRAGTGVDLGGDGAFVVQLSATDGNNSGKYSIHDNISNHLRGRFYEGYQVATLSGVDTPVLITNNTMLSYRDDLNGNTIPEKILLFGAAKAIMQGNMIQGEMASDIQTTDFSTFYPVLDITENTWITSRANIIESANSTVFQRGNKLLGAGEDNLWQDVTSVAITETTGSDIVIQNPTKVMYHPVTKRVRMMLDIDILNTAQSSFIDILTPYEPDLEFIQLQWNHRDNQPTVTSGQIDASYRVGTMGQTLPVGEYECYFEYIAQ